MKRHLIGWAIMLGIFGGILLDGWIESGTTPIVYAKEPDPPRVVLLEVKIDWTELRIKEEIRRVFPEDSETMIKVAWCESRLIPTARNVNTNGTQDRGLFQLNDIHEFEGDLFDVRNNLKHARTLYDRNGLSDWRYSKHCWNG